MTKIAPIPLSVFFFLLSVIPGALEAYTLRVTHPTGSGGIVELEGIAGTPTGRLPFAVELAIPDGAAGVHSWRVGLSHDPSVLTVASATLAGTAADGAAFSTLEVLPSGIVSSVVLDEEHLSLLPAGSRSRLLAAEYEGAYPAKDTTVQTRLRLVDGLEGAGGPITTGITAWDGSSEAIPASTRENLIVLLSGFEYSTAFDLSMTTQGAVPDEGGELLRGFITNGMQPVYAVRVLLHSKLPPGSASGAQGWSLSISHDPAILEPAGMTIEETAAGDLLRGGFERHEVIGNQSGDGVISAVVLSLTEPVSLPPVGRFDILEVGYRWVADTTVDGVRRSTRIDFQDKLRGQGQPVNNVVTLGGASNRPLVRRGLALELEVGEPPQQPFIRSDANGNGRVNIADAVWLLSDLFFRGPSTACLYAADTNSDGRKDISDVAFLLQFQFLGGRPPSSPFPDCGTVANQDPARCPIGSTSCP